MRSMSTMYLSAVFAFLMLLLPQGSAHTDNLEVKALQDLYQSLNTPPQLKGWKTGRDPCAESWTGVTCSGSFITELKLDSQNISGNLGYQLNNLPHLKQLDASNNRIYGEIPYNLPLNLTYLNLSHNYMSGPIANVFAGLPFLKEMDLSYNQFTGDLPSSFGTLRGLSRLFLQHNQLTGSVLYLARLKLTDLNIEHNKFSGIIPRQLRDTHNLCIGGNVFENEVMWRKKNSAETVHTKESKHGFFVGGLVICFMLGIVVVMMASRGRASGKLPAGSGKDDERKKPSKGTRRPCKFVDDEAIEVKIKTKKPKTDKAGKAKSDDAATGSKSKGKSKKEKTDVAATGSKPKGKSKKETTDDAATGSKSKGNKTKKGKKKEEKDAGTTTETGSS